MSLFYRDNSGHRELDSEWATTGTVPAVESVIHGRADCSQGRLK